MPEMCIRDSILTVIAVAATWMVPAGSYSKLAFDSSSQMLQVTSPQGEVESLPATQEQLDKLNVKIGIEKFTGGSLKKPISIPGTYQRLDSTPQGIADITQSMVTGTVEAADLSLIHIWPIGNLAPRHNQALIAHFGCDPIVMG